MRFALPLGSAQGGETVFVTRVFFFLFFLVSSVAGGACARSHVRGDTVPCTSCDRRGRDSPIRSAPRPARRFASSRPR